MRKPAYKDGEKISWYPEGNASNGLETGIIKEGGPWAKSFHYLIKDIEPHHWVKEEWIVGWEDRRRLRNKLDNVNV